MNAQPSLFEPEIKIIPSRKVAGRVTGLFQAPHRDFETVAVENLQLGFDGIAGDFHQGITRKSGGREPWYPRGTEICNERQLTIVAPDELAKIAALMQLDELHPEWIGANMLLEGIGNLSMLPSGSLMFFEGGVTLKIDGQNAPCKLAGGRIAKHCATEDQAGMALRFPKVARRLRGLTAWVEKPGEIRVGEAVTIRVPEQWIYSV
ncbi:MOSC domain-containing protein [Limoniibacter endophyticus]|uniref:Molybdenum cofactor sulfurase n=1 Tax=Limoniibacter endophyticus TaxID=1565040 RepID=A0A8J3DII8_9HYPH|nr:MOSC domain-containing protein [Limoniibacter endophyticus]GHC75083.1 molybdenum cofactor sulfurase [Limoniibacter endophyticus]